MTTGSKQQAECCGLARDFKFDQEMNARALGWAIDAFKRCEAQEGYGQALGLQDPRIRIYDRVAFDLRNSTELLAQEFLVQLANACLFQRTNEQDPFRNGVLRDRAATGEFAQVLTDRSCVGCFSSLKHY